MNFLLDECFSYRFAPMLRPLCEHDSDQVLHLVTDLGFKNTDDVDWIDQLDPKVQWVLLTRDDNMRKLKLERDEWQKRGVIGFFFTKQWAHANIREQRWRLVRWWPYLEEIASKAKPGSGFRIPWQGEPKRKLAPIP